MKRSAGTVVRGCVIVTLVVLGVVAAHVSEAAADDGDEGDATPDTIGVVDTAQGLWYLRDPASGSTTSFYFGNPGDEPFTGDWDCDGVDTPGLYRRSDGYVYLRNTNTQGVAETAYFFGNPGDLPLAGDFDGDGCDTVALYRPSNGRFYVIDELGSDDGGLGAATVDYAYGDLGDHPFVGDFDGDGIDTFGMHRPGSGVVHLRNTHSEGPSDLVFTFGDAGDIVLAGAFGDGATHDSVGLFRPSTTMFHLRYTNERGPADESHMFGNHTSTPIAGDFGDLPGGSAPPVVAPHLVSEFTTYHPPRQDRNININLIADLVDGAVVQPGEVWSLNDHVGPRTIEKGFVPAGAIIGGEIYCCDHPANIGGGTSQFATTLYNAVFFGGYEDVYHRPHSLYFSRYPVVREATLSYPGPDVQFRNDTAFPLTIHAGHTSTAVTVQIYGDNEGRRVETTTLGDVSSSEGGTATTYRTIVYANGTYRTESWTHTYNSPIPE